MCTVGFENDVARVKLLVAAGASLEEADYDKRTIGHLAAAEGHFAILEYLANNSSFNFELEDRWGTKPLYELKDFQQKMAIKKLIDSRGRTGSPSNPRVRDFIASRSPTKYI